MSVRRVCGVLGQPRSTERYQPRESVYAERLAERLVALATEYERYGYRRVTGLLGNEGWRVNHKRVERIWRREGLKVPKRQPKRYGRTAPWVTDPRHRRPESSDRTGSEELRTERD